MPEDVQVQVLSGAPKFRKKKYPVLRTKLLAQLTRTGYIFFHPADLEPKLYRVMFLRSICLKRIIALYLILLGASHDR